MRAFAAALAIAVAVGLAIGFWLGFHRLSGEVFEPMLVAVYSIPKITLYPILLLAFGLGMSAKIAFGAIHGIIPVALFTINAVRNIEPILIKTGRALKLGPAEMVRSILFPAALPEIFTGLRVGFSLTLIGTLLGEMFAVRGASGASIAIIAARCRWCRPACRSAVPAPSRRCARSCRRCRRQ